MLIINFLNNFFKLYFCSDITALDIVRISNVVYIKDNHSKESEGFLGFFDWLRTTESEIVGIRICYFDDLPYNKILQHFPFTVSSFDNKCFEFFFKGDSYNPEISGEQDFTNNFVYQSKENSYLFTFGLDHLTKQEFDTLLKYCEVLRLEDITQAPNNASL